MTPTRMWRKRQRSQKKAALPAAGPWTPASRLRGGKFLPSKPLVRGTSRLQPQDATTAHAAGTRAPWGAVRSGGGPRRGGSRAPLWLCPLVAGTALSCQVEDQHQGRPRAWGVQLLYPASSWGAFIFKRETRQSESSHPALLHRDRGSEAVHGGERGPALVLGSLVMGVPLPAGTPGLFQARDVCEQPSQRAQQTTPLPPQKQKKREQKTRQRPGPGALR